jgi:hypothetical protein
MADFFKGLAGGLETGARFGQMLREGEERKRLREAMGLTPQEIAPRPPTQDELGRAQAYTQGIADEDARMFATDDSVERRTGLFSSNPAERPLDASVTPQMPYVGQSVGGTQYRLGDQTLSRMPTQQEIDSARYAAAANVIAERDPAAAMRMRQEQVRMQREAELAPLQKQQLEGSIAGQAQQRDVTAATLRGLGRAEARETGFDTAFDAINKTEYKTPAERDAAVLAAVSQFKGPEAAAQLQANYSTNERNKILTDGAKFDQTIKQARLKGPAAALKAIDDLNDSFKLEIDGFKVTQVNNDGTRVPFLQGKNADEFALLVDSRIRDGGAFELAKFRQDEQTNTARVEYFKSMTEKAKREGGAAANQLSGVQLGYSRDPNGNPIQVMSAMRFNKRTGDLESVQVPLQQNVVPASALDPKKIAEQAEALVGQPIDPTNKKSKVVYTFATAQQAVVDQIFNQYLGTGGPADGVAKSDAQRILDQQKRPAGAAPASVGLSTQGQQATVPTERPTRRDGESFTDFRNRTVAWDENRMAYEQQMRNEELQRRLGANVTGLMNRPLTQ